MRSYPHPESRTEDERVYVVKVVLGERLLDTNVVGEGLVVWLLRRVVTSKPSCSHIVILTNRLPTCLLRVACPDVTCKQASEAWYSAMSVYMRSRPRWAGEDMRCLHCSSRLPNAQSHVANRQIHPHQSSPVQSLSLARGCLPRWLAPSFSLTNPKSTFAHMTTE